MSNFIYQLPGQVQIFDYIVYSVTILTGIFFIMISIKNFKGDPGMVDDFKRWLYPAWFRKTVAVWQLTCGALLTVLPVSYIPALLLVILMAGAVYTHLKHDPPYTSAAALVFLIILSYIFWYLKPPVVS